MRRFFVLALTAVACGPSVTLTTDRSAYHPGDDLTLTLQNSSLAQIGYGLCSAFLLDADGAIVPDISEERYCAGVEPQLRSGERVSSSRRLPAALEAGAYHYRTSLSFDESNAEIVSNAFDVAP